MKNVLLLFGGKSYEHDISIVTASQIYNKTRLENICLIPMYISKNSRFFVYLNKKFILKDFVDFNENKTSKYFKEIVFVSGENGKLFCKTLFGLKEYMSADIAINACHGGDGENGRLISFLENHGIFSSSGSVDGLGISMNKMLFKTFMRGIKVSSVPGFVVNQTKYIQNKDSYFARLKFLSFPKIIKPLNGGSSIGLFVAKSRDDFEKMINLAFEFDEDVLVEDFISNAREFNVAVCGDCQEFMVSEIDEPLKLSEVLSFDDKYFGGGKSVKDGTKNSMLSQKKKFPADIDVKLADRIKIIAKKVFCTLNLSGVVRIDFLYDEANDKLYVCELNAVPGSLAYYFFAGGKVLINDFILRLINVAEKKSKQDSLIKNDFITKILT